MRAGPPPAISTTPRSSDTAQSPTPNRSSSAKIASSTAPSIASVMSPPSPRPSWRDRSGRSGKRVSPARPASVPRRENASQSASRAAFAGIRRRILGPMPTRVDGLTEPQLEAVTHRGGPLLVVGGAGSGKTRVLCERFEALTRDGASPGSLLMLARDGDAATAVRERVEAAIETPFEELWIETFAGFCARLLCAEAVEAGLDPLFARVTRADRLALLLERIDDLTLRRHEIRGNPAPLLASLLARIDRLKDEMIAPDEYRAYAERLEAGGLDDATRAHARREAEFARLYADHESLLRARGALDAGGLVLAAFDLLHRRPHVRARLARRFAAVLVDDLQDVTFAETALLRLVCAEQPELTIATDDDQATRRSARPPERAHAELEREFPGARTVRLGRSERCPRKVVDAACAVVAPLREGRRVRRLPGRGSGGGRFWRCSPERGEAQQAAAHVEQLLANDRVAPERICLLIPSLRDDVRVLGAALEERALPFRVVGSAAYFQRAEVRDVLAWLRLLAAPGAPGAVGRAVSRPPIELRPVDIARLTQLARRRKLDMVSGIAAALESPQLSPEGRDRATHFLRIHRSASRAFEKMPPDLFVHRLIERIGLRRQQVFAAHADTVERLVNIAKLSELANRFVRREPGATTRDFTRYATAVAEAGLPEEEAEPAVAPSTVRVLALEDAKGHEFEHVVVLGLSAASMPGPPPPAGEQLPAALAREPGATHEERMRRMLHVAITRARRGVVLSWAVSAEHGPGSRPSPFVEEAREAMGCDDELHEEQLFGPAEGLHSTFRLLRDELLDTVSQVGGRLAEMRLDTYIDVSQAVVRYLELLKLAALIERAKDGQGIDQALAEVNDLLLQVATPEQAEMFRISALDDYLRDAEGDERRRRTALDDGDGETLEPFIPRRGEGLMLSASDIETYRL